MNEVKIASHSLTKLLIIITESTFFWSLMHWTTSMNEKERIITNYPSLLVYIWFYICPKCEYISIFLYLYTFQVACECFHYIEERGKDAGKGISLTRWRRDACIDIYKKMPAILSLDERNDSQIAIRKKSSISAITIMIRIEFISFLEVNNSLLLQQNGKCPNSIKNKRKKILTVYSFLLVIFILFLYR